MFGIFTYIGFAFLAIFITWRIVSVLRKNPEMLSWENLKKSSFSMGALALILIGFVALMVLMLRSS